MMGYRLHRMAAGVLAGVLAALAVAATEAARAGSVDGAAASLAILLGVGALGGVWLGLALMGLDWSQPLSSSFSTLCAWLRVENRNRETEKVARTLAALLGVGAWLLGAFLLSQTLAARIVRPGLEAAAITLSVGLWGAALWSVVPAVRDLLEDLLGLRGRLLDRHLGLCSVAGMSLFSGVTMLSAGFLLRTPVYNILYAMDLNLLLALGVGLVASVAGLVLLAFGPGARVVEVFAGVWRLGGLLAALCAVTAWGLAATEDDAVREALFDHAPTASSLYALLHGEDPGAETPASPSVAVEEEEPPPLAPVPVAAPGAGEIRHVIFLSMDTVRADHLGAYGYTRHPTSPSVDAFAAAGTRFARAYSSGPCTSASFTGMVTSELPNRVRGLTRDGDIFLLPARVTTLAGRFREAGWHTRALMPVVGDYLKGIDRGFVQFDGSFHYAEALADRAIKTLAHDGETRRTFTWIHFIDAHWPYEAHKGFTHFGKKPEDLYDAELAHMDQEVGRVLTHLKDGGWLKDTLVVIFSDHGEAFGEHGTRLHGNSLYDEEIHVPLIMVGPGIPVGVNPSPFSLLDLGPTVRELVGIPNAAQPVITGISEAALLRQGPASGRTKLAEGCKPGSMLAMIDDDKLFYRKKSGLYFLYNLAKDPLEKVNLFHTQPDAQKLAQRARQQLAGQR